MGAELLVDDEPSAVDESVVVRRRPWPLLIAIAAVLATVVVVSIVTREPAADSASPDTTAPASTVAPATTAVPTTVSDTDEANESTALEVDPQPEPTFGTATDAAGSVEPGEVEVLPLNVDVVAALPAGGIDGWMFSLVGRTLTRTDLTTAEQVAVDVAVRASAFPGGEGRMVVAADSVVIGSNGQVVVVDAATLESTDISPSNPATVVAYTSTSVWVAVQLDTDSGTTLGLQELPLDGSEPAEALRVDPIGIGFIAAGATDDLLRYHVPFLGTWDLSSNGSELYERGLLTGTFGGTVEFDCSGEVGDCATVIVNLATGEEAPIELPTATFSLKLSPNLEWVATPNQAVSTSGDVVELRDSGFEWNWSNDGRFLSSRTTIVDVTGELARFEVPSTFDAPFDDRLTVVVVR